MMSDNPKVIIERARELIRARQFDRARVLLNRVADHPTAKVWLEELNKLDPAPETLEEAQEDLEDAQHELEAAEEDVEQAETRARRVFRANTAVLVFLGSLLGSLLGAAADAGEAVNTFNEFRAFAYPELCVVGSNTILGEGLGMGESWAESFESENRVRVSVDPVGSTAGLRRAIDGGCANVLAMSEPMTQEQEAELTGNGVEIACAAEIGYDIIVFVTDINNPVTTVTRPELSGILQGRTANWNAFSTDFDNPVTIFAREGSGTTDVVLRNVASFDSEGGRVFPDRANYVICDTNGDCLDRTLSQRGALYWVSAAWMHTQPPEYLKVLKMLQGDEAGVNPLLEDVDLRRYPSALQRPLYMYVLTRGDTSVDTAALSENFLRYVRGVSGQQILEDNFFYTHFDEPTDVDVPLPAGFDPVGSPNRAICKAGALDDLSDRSVSVDSE